MGPPPDVPVEGACGPGVRWVRSQDKQQVTLRSVEERGEVRLKIVLPVGGQLRQKLTLPPHEVIASPIHHHVVGDLCLALPIRGDGVRDSAQGGAPLGKDA